MPEHSRDREEQNRQNLNPGDEVVGRINDPNVPGQNQPTPNMPQGGGSPLGDLFGSLMSGGTNPLGGLLGGLFGGGGGAIGGMGNMGMGQSPLAPFVAPIADSLAKRFGLSPAIAQAIVAFALTKLAESMTNRGQSSGTGSSAGALYNRLASGQSVNQQYLQQSGLAQELAAQSGMDEQTAAASLQQVLSGLGDQLQSQ